MRKTAVTALLVLPVLAGGVAGCGQPEGGDSLRGATVEVLAFWSGGEQDAFTRVYERFERQTGVDVRYLAGGDELATILQTRIQGGDPPDIAIVPQPGVVWQLARAGNLMPLSGIVADELAASYAPVWSELGTVDGQLYAVYFKATNKSTFWYNTDVLARHGLGPPRTWDDLIKTCHRLSDFGVPPVSIGGADGWVLTDWFENVYLHEAGTQLYDQLSRHQIPWTHPSVRRAFSRLAQLFGDDRLIKGGAAGALQTDFTDSVVDVFGPQADTAMVYEGDFVAAVIQRDTRARVGENAKFVPFPVVNRGPAAVVVGGDAAVALKGDRATMEFLRYLASAQAGAEWAKLGGFLSPNRQVPPDAYPDEPTRELARQIQQAGDNIRFDMSDLYPAQFGASKGAGQWKAMQDFLNDADDIDAVLRQLETAATDAMQ